MCFQTIFCGVICKSSRQSLKTGIGKSCSRKEIVLHFIISRSFLFIHSPHTPLPSTHTPIHTPIHTGRCCLTKVRWVSVVMLTHPCVKRRPNICCSWLRLLSTPAASDPRRRQHCNNNSDAHQSPAHHALHLDCERETPEPERCRLDLLATNLNLGTTGELLKFFQPL